MRQQALSDVDNTAVFLTGPEGASEGAAGGGWGRGRGEFVGIDGGASIGSVRFEQGDGMPLMASGL